MLPIKEYIKRPRLTVTVLLQYFGSRLPDKIYLEWLFRLRMGYRLDLKNPKTFSEKLQWLKLYDRKPEYTTMVDKYAVKDYVASIIGPQYIIPTLGVWERPEDIEWDKLPNQFVLKTTHGGGSAGVIICRDKETFDKQKAIAKLNKSLKQDIYKSLREWPYKNVSRRIIAEKYIEPRHDVKEMDITQPDLYDYKYFCFDGEVKFFKIDFGRHTEHHANYYDCDANLLPFGEANFPPNPGHNLAIPQNLVQMIDLAEQLSAGESFLRVDFYNVAGRIYFGEITFYPASGLSHYTPEEWDERLGQLVHLI